MTLAVDLPTGTIHVLDSKTAAGVRSVDLTPALREELTLAQIDHHADSIEELDVEGHPGVRRARFAARLGPVGASVA